MKLLIVSDIHSNAPALAAVLAAEPEVNEIYCAGDLTDYGPFPCETLALCRAHRIRSVLGNHDRALLERYRRGDFGEANENRNWSQHNCERLSKSDIDYLSSLPETLDFHCDGFSYRITHQYGNGYGRPTFVDGFDGAFPPCEAPRRLILGHTHRQATVTLRGERMLLNPGSVSYRRPDDSDKSAHYAVIENGTVTLKAVSYDRSALLRETLALAKTKTLAEGELKVAFFFFGSAPNIFTPVEESIQTYSNGGFSHV